MRTRDDDWEDGSNGISSAGVSNGRSRNAKLARPRGLGRTLSPALAAAAMALACLPCDGAMSGEMERAPQKPSAARTPAEIAAEDLRNARAMPDGKERWLAESRARFQLGRATADASERDRLLLEGVRLAERARDADPASAEAIELWVANAGTHASHHRNFTSLRLVPKLEESLLKLVELDPSFDSAAGDRGLAGLYFHAPGIISVGSMRKARERAKAAFDRFPDHPANRLAWAEILLRDGKRQEAAQHAEAVLSSPKLSDYPHDAADWRRRAERLLRDAG